VTCYELSRLAEVGYWVEGTFISDLVSVDRDTSCLWRATGITSPMAPCSYVPCLYEPQSTP